MEEQTQHGEITWKTMYRASFGIYTLQEENSSSLKFSASQFHDFSPDFSVLRKGKEISIALFI